MLLNSLIESLEDKLPLTVIGKFSEASAVRAFRAFVLEESQDDLLYVLDEDDLQPNADNEHYFKGFYILYNPEKTYVSARFITIYSDASYGEFINAVMDFFEAEYTVSSWFHSVYTLAIRSKSPAQLLQDLKANFHNHFILLSSSLYIVNSTLEEVSESPFFESKHTRYYLSLEVIEHIQQTGLLDKAMKATSAFKIDDDFFGVPMILANIRIGNYVTGYFISIQTDKQFTLQDPAMITFLAEVMGQKIYYDSVNKKIQDERKRSEEYLVRNL